MQKFVFYSTTEPLFDVWREDANALANTFTSMELHLDELADLFYQIAAPTARMHIKRATTAVVDSNMGVFVED
jgi:hypothetical protein